MHLTFYHAVTHAEYSRRDDIMVAINTSRVHSKSRRDDSMILVKSNNNKAGYYNLEGKEVIPLIYEEAGNFKDGLAQVSKN